MYYKKNKEGVIILKSEQHKEELDALCDRFDDGIAALNSLSQYGAIELEDNELQALDEIEAKINNLERKVI
jgi:hypothetical protein